MRSGSNLTPPPTRTKDLPRTPKGPRTDRKRTQSGPTKDTLGTRFGPPFLSHPCSHFRATPDPSTSCAYRSAPATSYFPLVTCGNPIATSKPTIQNVTKRYTSHPPLFTQPLPPPPLPLFSRAQPVSSPQCPNAPMPQCPARLSSPKSDESMTRFLQ